MFISNPDNFTALEWKRATYSGFLCEIGVTVVEDGEIIETREWKVKPPMNFYQKGADLTCDISEEDTKDSPELSEVWSDIKPYLRKKRVFLFNRNYSEFATSFHYYSLPDPGIADYNDLFCSLFPYSIFGVAVSFGLDWIEDEHSGNISRVIAEVYLKYLYGEMPNRSYIPDEVYAYLVRNYNERPKIISKNKLWWINLGIILSFLVAVIGIMYFWLLVVVAVIIFICVVPYRQR